MMNTLVVIDDERAFADFVAWVATTANYEARVAVSVAEFLDGAEQDWPGVLIIDLHMPDIDGIELLRELAERRCPSRIILVSGADGRVLDSAYRLGEEIGLAMAGKASKPVRAPDVRKLLVALQGEDGAATAQDLSRALDENRLFLLYQPKIDVRTRQMVGVEALARCRDRSGRVLMPDSFIPLAEKNGLIDRLTDWVIDEGFRQLGSWRQQGYDLHLAINLSVRTIHDRQFPNRLAARCAAAGIASEHVTLELTETASTQNFTMLLEILGRFRLKGFQLSIDDFGTGYSSVLQLLRLPFSELKVDKSFVIGLTQVREAEVVTKTLIDMAHNLGLLAVAEGVETEAAFSRLAEWGCDLAQGYLFSRPVEPAAIEALMAGDCGSPCEQEC